MEQNQIQSRTGPELRTEMRNAPILRESVTVLTDVGTAFSLWRDFANLPTFMTDVTRVSVISPTRSHWEVELPRGPKVEWDAEVLEEREGEMIAWRSVGGSRVRQSGTVWFWPAPAGRGTIVRLSLSYEIPGGGMTELATKLLLEDPKTLVLSNLRRFKAFAETGVIATTEGQPSGREPLISKEEAH